MDLYYRINGAELNVPSLRHRKDDLPAFIGLFLGLFSAKYGKAIAGLDESATWILNSYEWPGNIRELKNCLERAIIVCDGSKIGVSDLPDSIAGAAISPEPEIDSVLDGRREYMKESIQAALKRTNGNKSEAAKVLKITRRTLYNWIRDLGMEA
jgi:two-component system response regulator HydG